MIKSCYIHIPFCSTICSYCDFCKQIYQEKLVKKYLDALEEEILKNYQGEELDTIYIGGGTPSCLSVLELTRLFQILSLFKKSKNFEYTIEGNFSSTTLEKLLLYRKYGINRLSFGMESIDPKNLEFLGRVEGKEEVQSVISLARSLGFSNINVDLMYALPLEDMDVLSGDLDFLLSLNVEHISTYSLMIEDHTLLKIKGVGEISEDLDHEMYQMICDKLGKHHYIHYEISNFA